MEVRKYLDFENDFEEIRDAIMADWGGSVSALLYDVYINEKEGQLARILDTVFSTADLGEVCEYIEANIDELRQKLDLAD